MNKIEPLPIAHLINSDPIGLHSHNLIEMLEHHASNGSVALTFLDRSNNERHRTHRDLLEGARVVANYLKNRGLKPGDKVVLLLLNNEHFVDSFFGTILAGGVPVATSPPMTFGDIDKYLSNLQHILRNSQARYMISFPRIRKVIGRVLAADNDLEAFILAKDIAPEPPKVPGYPSIDPDSPAFFQYTSGSTGLPKGAMLSHRALLSNVAGIAKGIDCNPKDISISWLPLFHDMGLIGSLFTALYTGAHLYTMLPETFVINPVSWLEHITRYRGTIATAPNFAYHLLATRVTDEQMKDLDLSTLKVALNGAEPVDLRTLEAFEHKFSAVGYGSNVSFPVYGMAENCLAATFPPLGGRVEVQTLDRIRLEGERLAVEASPADRFFCRAVSVGYPIADQEVAVRAEGGGHARENQVGEVLVKGPSLMLGYYRNPEATAETIRDGWLHTGDLGFIRNRRLFITGRAKEMIIKRGRNLYPYDIERAATQVRGVRKGCLVAFSLPNAQTGTEDLVLVAETRESDTRERDRIAKSISAEVLAAVGVRPDQTVLVPPRSIPKTSSGKLQRLLTKRRYVDGTLVKGVSDRWLTPAKILVGSFIGNQRFRLRAR